MSSSRSHHDVQLQQHADGCHPEDDASASDGSLREQLADAKAALASVREDLRNELGYTLDPPPPCRA